MTLLKDTDLSGLDLEDGNTAYTLVEARQFDDRIGQECRVDAQDCCLEVAFTATYLGPDVETVAYRPETGRRAFLFLNGFAFDNGVIASGTEIRGAIRGTTE